VSKSGQGALDLKSDKARALALISVSRETENRLDRFVDVLLLWQSKLNLIAPSTLRELWTRHIADSLQRGWTLAQAGDFQGRSLPVRSLTNPARRCISLKVMGKR
jgi:hypothetical protein